MPGPASTALTTEHQEVRRKTDVQSHVHEGDHTKIEKPDQGQFGIF